MAESKIVDNEQQDHIDNLKSKGIDKLVALVLENQETVANLNLEIGIFQEDLEAVKSENADLKNQNETRRQANIEQNIMLQKAQTELKDGQKVLYEELNRLEAVKNNTAFFALEILKSHAQLVNSPGTVMEMATALAAELHKPITNFLNERGRKKETTTKEG